MNSEQRKYLVGRIESTAKDQMDEIKAQREVELSLNNYLIAAFLDGSIKFADLDTLRSKIKGRVIKMGSNAQLVDNEERRDRWSGSSKTMKNVVQVPAHELFIIPDNYVRAWKDWKKREDALDAEIENIKALRDTIVMKIQIGSNAHLDKLVMQIDDIGNLSLSNTQLLLNPESK